MTANSLGDDLLASLTRRKQAIWAATSSEEERQRLWTQCKTNMQSYLANDAMVRQPYRSDFLPPSVFETTRRNTELALTRPDSSRTEAPPRALQADIFSLDDDRQHL